MFKLDSKCILVNYFLKIIGIFQFNMEKWTLVWLVITILLFTYYLRHVRPSKAVYTTIKSMYYNQNWVITFLISSTALLDLFIVLGFVWLTGMTCGLKGN